MLWLHKQYFYIALRMEYKTTMEGRAHGSSQQKYLAHDPGPRPSREIISAEYLLDSQRI